MPPILSSLEQVYQLEVASLHQVLPRPLLLDLYDTGVDGVAGFFVEDGS
jgi:hypothetical protein